MQQPDDKVSNSISIISGVEFTQFTIPSAFEPPQKKKKFYHQMTFD